MHMSNNYKFAPIESVTSQTVSTDEASYYLNRKPQTLRMLACMKNSTIQPIKINGRLAWRVNDIKKLLGM